ncbi:MAG: 3-oxoacyl-ACP reductase family protein [Anaerolineae bacterium]|nr:3-oxoacyl-ACP reductase family protein [Anaerolineae bacterium]
MIDLTNKIVIVTGGAQGIGRAIVAEFAQAGAEVVIADLQDEAAQATAQVIGQQSGCTVVAVQTDVTSLESVRHLVEHTIDQFGRIDVLVNNAGWDKFIPFLKTTPDFWDKIINLNYKGTLNTCYAVLPHMVAAKSGCIVNIASDAGRGGSLGESIYAGCKAAVIAFSKTLAREHARDNIRVNAVSPGITETGLYDEIVATDFGQKVMGAIANTVPLGRRPGRPEEISPAVVFLASDAARYITGQVLSVNGGLTMQD